jgi:hypothetical protein
MKTTTIILFVMVSLSLVFSLVSFLIVVENHLGFGFSGTGNTQKTNAPSPTPIPSSSVSISYNESSREEISALTKVTLTVNITYVNGADLHLRYSQFYLKLYAQRLFLHIPAGEVYPLNNGTFTLGVSHRTEIFQLVFKFPTISFNNMDDVRTLYQLAYNGPPYISWTS